MASEVEQYDLSHLRRLDVLPGITGSVAGGGSAGSVVRQLYLAGHGVRGELEPVAGSEDSGADGWRGVERNRSVAKLSSGSKDGRLKGEDSSGADQSDGGGFRRKHTKDPRICRRALAKRALDLVVFPELAVCGYPPADLSGEEAFFSARAEQVVDEIAQVDGGVRAARRSVRHGDAGDVGGREARAQCGGAAGKRRGELCAAEDAAAVLRRLR